MKTGAKAEKIKIRVVAKDGSKHRVRAEYLDVDFGDGRRLLLTFDGQSEKTAVLRLKAVCSGKAEPVLAMQSNGGNALAVYLSCQPDAVHRYQGEPPVRITVQKACGAEDKAYTPRKHRIRSWVRAALPQVAADITVRLVGEEEGRVLNKTWRGKDYATNVLTFAYNENETDAEAAAGTVLTGDIVLCVPVVVREARERQRALEAHFAHLVVHGMLHLQGYDHEENEAAQIMEGREKEILAGLGYPDPYAGER